MDLRLVICEVTYVKLDKCEVDLCPQKRLQCWVVVFCSMISWS